MMPELIQELKEKLQHPLPGVEAQLKMANVIRKNYSEPPSDARIACVLALLFPKNDIWHLALIVRNSDNPNDRHGGQIGFPGGKQEEDDKSLEMTAIRETEEEIGIKGIDVQIIGNLTELYIPVSNFLVYPYVGYLPYTPEFKRQETEVKLILEVPFTHFLDPSIRQRIDLQVRKNITLKNVPYFNIDGKILWGATAMMMSELVEVAMD